MEALKNSSKKKLVRVPIVVVYSLQQKKRYNNLDLQNLYKINYLCNQITYSPVTAILAQNSRFLLQKPPTQTNFFATTKTVVLPSNSLQGSPMNLLLWVTTYIVNFEKTV